MEAVVAHLAELDPAAARRARERYACFDHFGRDPQVYGLQTGIAGAESCERQVVEQLVELRERAAGLAARAADAGDADAAFYVEQNARLVVNAERYYRAMFRGGVESWNVRDSHMAETLDELVAHLERASGPAKAKVVVWAHNSHLGDARATETGREGELNLGQLVRERAGADALLVGFTTYAGTVTAASDWGGPAERMRVRPALAGSWEELLHARGAARLVLDAAELPGERLQRAIGAIYRPQAERVSHYLRARIAEQFDAIVHIDETHALRAARGHERVGGRRAVYSALRNASEGMKKYSPPFIVTVCGASATRLTCVLSHLTGQSTFGREPWPMTWSRPGSAVPTASPNGNPVLLAQLCWVKSNWLASSELNAMNSSPTPPVGRVTPAAVLFGSSLRLP